MMSSFNLTSMRRGLGQKWIRIIFNLLLLPCCVGFVIFVSLRHLSFLYSRVRPMYDSWFFCLVLDVRCNYGIFDEKTEA